MNQRKKNFKYFYLLEFLEISLDLQKMDKKFAKSIDSNLRNVTKALHVPKREFASKE